MSLLVLADLSCAVQAAALAENKRVNGHYTRFLDYRLSEDNPSSRKELGKTARFTIFKTVLKILGNLDTEIIYNVY